MTSELAIRHLSGGHTEDLVEGCPLCFVMRRTVLLEGERPVRENTTHPPTGRTCACGCGRPVRRRFLPGHDAKLKSRLVKEARSGSEAALQNLREHGWEHFV